MTMFISAKDAREAEHEARCQTLALARLYLRTDESKATSPSDVMRVRQIMGAVSAGNAFAFDAMLSERETQRLFNVGALWFCPTG